MSFLFDSSLLILSLNNALTAEAERLLLHDSRAISRISWIEVLAGASMERERETREFLARFVMLEITPSICERTLRPRREIRLKLPDAIIYATALATGRTLVRYNTRDFHAGRPSVLIPT